MKKTCTARLGLTHSDFFALRTPLLPWDEYLAWSAGLDAPTAAGDPPALEAALQGDRRQLRERLRGALQRPEVREAVFVASPSLHEALDVWRDDPASVRGQKTERALVRYFSRMTGRPTPFGLFAGCSVGAVGEATNLAIEASTDYYRNTRLDTEYVLALAESLAQEPGLRPHLKFRPNTTLYRAAGQVRYAESRFVGGRRSHHLVAVDETEYLAATLRRAAGGARFGDLAAALVDDEISLEDALGFIDELIDSQLLEADLQPSVTGPEPIHVLIEKLESLPEGAGAAARLRQVRDAIAAIDAQGGAGADGYQQIAAALEAFSAPVELPRLFQVDLFKPAPQASLSSRVVDELQRGVEVLASMTEVETESALATIRQEFLQRYEGREVPVVEALDEEIGIGFARSQGPEAEGSPLLAGLAFSQAVSGDAPWRGRYGLLLSKLIEASGTGSQQIELSAADVERMAAANPAPVPTALSAMASLSAPSAAAVEQGDFQLIFQGGMGPSGARMLGRFCHGDPRLQQHVEDHLRAEESLAPDAIFAEVVHLPEGRTGNVLLRPVLRGYEIPYLGRSGAPDDKQIPITDLLVSVRNDRIMLHSAALGREIVPRLTNAHNYAWKGLGLYKFLCAMQHQGGAGGFFWSWGPLESAAFLPRVVHGRLVLARARWLLAGAELKSLAASKGGELYAAVQRWRAERRVPRFVALRDDDNELPIDLDNILSIEAAADVLKGRDNATLVEMFVDDLPVHGPEGRFVHEIVVPLVMRQPPEPAPQQNAVVAPTARPRRFAPGSEWLYAKIYTGTASADRLLRDELRYAVEQAAASGACDRWFFLRYSDPDPHLRLRLHGDRGRLLNEVLPLLEQTLAPALNEGWVWRVQYDTYERETERYGGEEGVELAEELFWADSAAALSIVASCPGDDGLDARWRLALRGVDQMLDDLGFDLRKKFEIVRLAKENFCREFGVGGAFKQQAGQKFRGERASLEAILNRANDRESPLEPGLAALDERSARLRETTVRLLKLAAEGRLTKPLEDLAGSYLHMWVNRVLRSAHRAQELVLYDFLDRLYQSAAARAQAAETAAPVLAGP